MQNKTDTLKFSCYFIWVILLFPFFTWSPKSVNPAPTSLTLNEGLVNPLGFYDKVPTFSWKLPVGVQLQGAYSIVVASSAHLLPNKADLWKSGKVATDQSIFVKYEGVKLSSRQKVYWQVKYWDSKGKESAWSETASFELGLLDNNDWKAKWINLANIKADSVSGINRKVHKVQYLRKNFKLARKVQKARLYISAKGLFEAQINGEKVGNDVLTPGWTPYQKRIETLTYDVSDLLKKGENTLGLMLGEGWHSGRLLFRNYAEKHPQVIAQLEVTYKNGKVETYVTDDTWKVTTQGPLKYSSIYDGELYDANAEMSNWSTSNFDDKNWPPVAAVPISETVELRPKRHRAITNKLTLPTINITEPTEGNVIFDLGQNMAGLPRINIPVKKGQRVRIRVAEMLQSDGTLFTENYRGALSTDFYIPASDGKISWQPKFTFHGFRYVELSGFDENATPQKSWVTGLVQYSDFKLSGTFTSSHKKLNQLQSNIEWGLRSNFLDIPTDCPQRNERLGWTGDAQVFVPTSLFIADAHAFWSSWMKSVREDQMDNGAIPVVVPNVAKERVSSGWGDAITVIPWEIYQRTGDKKVLEDNYEAMHKWLDFYESKATDHIVDMFTFGDWLQPYSKNGNKGETNEKLVSTAYYARSIDLTLQTAKVLGLKKDQEELQALLNAVRIAFQNSFFDENGMVRQGKPTQTAYLMAIGFELLTPDRMQKAIPHLLSEINKADNHLRTGFLGTPLLAPVLEKINRTDLMFEMLFKETYPSWFYSINQGATTMWERWDSYTHEDGFNEGGMNSFNHYAYGAIGQWMYERIGGIKPLQPGYKEILIAPLPGGPLSSAEARYDSPFGEIYSAWEKKNGRFYLEVTVPPNTSAKLILPINSPEEVQLNGEILADNSKIKLLKRNKNSVELAVQPGSYSFISAVN